MAVVTVSRDVGAGGDEIAASIARETGYELVDKALIVKVAERAGIAVDEAAAVDEKYESRMIEWLKTIIEPRVGKIITETGGHISPEDYIEYGRTVISSLAEKGNVVIVGRGSQFILQDWEGVFHVRIKADKAFRINRLVEKRGISEADARAIIEKADNMRSHYLERYFHDEWANGTVYDLVIDVSTLGVDESVKIITGAVAEFSRHSEFVPGERDRRKKERREQERRVGDRRETEVGVSQKEVTHMVMREGRPARSHTKPDRRKKDRRTKDRRSDD